MSEDLKSRCARLAKEGNLTPRSLWESARDPDDPLHSLFEWDSDQAAAKWRDEQARGYIAGIRLKVEISERVLTVPVYTRDVEKPDDEQGYVATLSLVNQIEKAKETVRRETAYAASALHRARVMAAALHNIDPLDDILKRLKSYRDAL